MTRTSMTHREKLLVALSGIFALSFAAAPQAKAHAHYGGISAGRFCIAWGLLCLPFLLAGFFSIRKTIQENRKALILLAMSGAFIFVISSLKIPSVTGSCSHMTGTGWELSSSVPPASAYWVSSSFCSRPFCWPTGD